MVYRMAPMSAFIRILTVVVLVIPVILASVGLFAVAALVVALYVWAWSWMRPRHFAVDDDAVVIVWPLRSRRIERVRLRSARLVTAGDFRRAHGLSIRIGVGGLWGGFGLLWTRGKTYDLYVSRTEGLVILERDADRPLLITPERPEAFVRSVTAVIEGT